jgi:MFS family permease
MHSLTYANLLRGNRGFRQLLGGQIASELGNWFNFIAALGLVRAISNAAPEATAALLIARLLPFALFAPIAGTFVDRLPRRTVMIVSDIGRGIAALGFFFVEDAGRFVDCLSLHHRWHAARAFFEGAKNAALANIVGSEGMLAGNALMFSSRFLLMSIGALAGGVAADSLGYRAAFALNALAFIFSAFCIWRIPHAAMQSGAVEAHADATKVNPFVRVWSDLREGWRYILAHKLVAAILGVNIMWAVGGGALNLIYDRLGGVVFAQREGWSGDTGVSVFYAAAGLGMVVGMLCVRRVGVWVEARGRVPSFIGWTLILHGVIFALTGIMPTLMLAALMVFLSRVVVAIEFAMQETLIMRLLPDHLRGRIFTTDRAAEIGVMSLSTAAAGASLTVITPGTLAILSGLLAGLPGVIWLYLFSRGSLRMPETFSTVTEDEAGLRADEDERQSLASA